MATAAAAMAARARREVKQFFMDQNAFSPDRAVDYAPTASIQQRYLQQLIDRGVVHETSPGRYWFDLPVQEEMDRQQFIWSIRILAVFAIIALIVFVVQMVMR